MPSSAPGETILAGLRARAAGLPVFERLDELHTSLATRPNVVLVAPPGAGKTTIVAPSLLEQPWLSDRRILLMLPRRLAARAAAERIAALLGEEVGARVGYRTRLESKVGPNCRIECVTEGIAVNRIVADPELAGVGALLFDEVHERNLDGDLGLALALDAQGGLRPDLRILAMSATLDGARFASLMGDAPVIESEGRQFPLTIHHVGRDPLRRMEDEVAATIQRALATESGSMLVFLPGVGEIERLAERLRLPDDVELHKLHGAADPRTQRAAVLPSRTRKCVLATAIAETSLTIDGVRLVVDAGLARRPRYDRGSGLTRLVTERASQAAVTQRAGRAARQGPGVVWRLWAEGMRDRIPFDPPEILESDLGPLLLQLAAFGVSDPDSLAWLDPPPAAAVAQARADLQQLDALDADGRLTAHGRKLSTLPLPPRLAHMVLTGAARGAAEIAAPVALLLQERGLGGNSTDLADRLAIFARDRSPRANAARRLAARWAERAKRLTEPEDNGPIDPASLLALAFPDRVARRRRAAQGSDASVSYLMANGSGVAVEASDALARCEWLAIGDAGGAGADSRLRLAAAFDAAGIRQWLGAHATHSESIAADPANGRMAAERVERLGAIVTARTRLAAPPAAAIAAALLKEALAGGLEKLPWPAAEEELRQRIAFAATHGLDGVSAVDDAHLRETADTWLLPRLTGIDRLADVRLEGTIAGLLDWQTSRALDRFAPARFETPAGTSAAIDYAADGGPEVEVRVQALFGLATHPMLAVGRVPLTLALTSPAGRVIQKTRDLPAFWQGSWAEVRREMRGRYPKHPWPEDPANAAPTTRAKPRTS
ncbi:MAG: ATP-dependent helicase HrpB [Sphingomonadaceae bacterium]